MLVPKFFETEKRVNVCAALSACIFRSLLTVSFLVTVLVFAPANVFAELSWRDGSVAHRSLPPPDMSKSYVRLDVPHIKQKPYLCVPTSAAMVIRYYGEKANPTQLKKLAEDHKPPNLRNVEFTYFVDLDHALRQFGYKWKIRSFPKTSAGFNSGLKQIKKHLSKGMPVLIDVHQDDGHTFVVTGFDDNRQVVFVRDPLLPKNRSRVFSYRELSYFWHDHRFGNSRTAVFTFPK
ncbi:MULTISPECIES: C39 family peptidase [unclassified Ruegeria]|uniref:C39 family peptidase n=1 Tax=unclassified Ruegeria TaxID=2625375 RepID=UPI001487C535|nr:MULTISPECIES: C39 family peptidase [unclassified Ruegeria]NOD75083.1 hypothetical protein [Ruegeria sp. HKCCD4332]NOD87044.1 hypothetical protein [Ruegeria sp. HKCCD4318]NOE12599.1 hypothetical protein [Ruegeria sp. HKCCD4318-2]NOG09236.1 C39 family peptidase [Ruegeria sp. HKCCD4315]